MQYLIGLHVQLYKAQGLRCDVAIIKATEQALQAYHDLSSYERQRYVVQLRSQIHKLSL